MVGCTNLDWKSEWEKMFYKDQGPTVEKPADFLIKIMSKQVSPSRVRRGRSVTVKVQYVVNGAPAKGKKFRLKQSLWFKRSKLAQVYNSRLKRTDGVWEESYVLDIPDDVDPGVYVVGIIFVVDGVMEKDHVFFSVTR
jgi:hypothetical protein